MTKDEVKNVEVAHTYCKEDKLDIVLAVLQEPTKSEEIAKKYEIGISTLYKWRNRFLEGGKQELLSYRPGPKSLEISDSEKKKDEKIKDYEKRIAELSADLEILKKNENWLPEALN